MSAGSSKTIKTPADGLNARLHFNGLLLQNPDMQCTLCGVQKLCSSGQACEPVFRRLEQRSALLGARLLHDDTFEPPTGHQRTKTPGQDEASSPLAYFDLHWKAKD